MKKITLLITLLITCIGFSQENKQRIQSYLNQNKASLQLSTQDVSDITIQSENSSTSTKINNCKVVQNYNGIEIFNTESSAWVKNNEVINFVNRFMKDVASKVTSSSNTLTSLQAVNKAYQNLGYTIPTFSVSEVLSNKTILISDGIHEDLINARLGYFLQENSLKLAWSLQLHSEDNKKYWDLKVDAVTGNIVYQKDLTISCNFGNGKHQHTELNKEFNFEANVFNAKSSMLAPTPANYRVIPYNFESPNHSPFQLVTESGEPTASPNGWHDINTTIDGTNAAFKFTYTRGNNIFAQEDANGDDGTGLRPDGGASLNFDFPEYTPGVGQTLQPTAYTNASTTNLFYMTNIMHDVWYKYGFDEVNANFQNRNYGRGGVASTVGDAVNAYSQDGYSQTTPTLDNANFTPTADGTRPKIQMFLWTLGAPPTNFITVNSPAPIAGPRSATTNVFEGTDRIPVPTAPNGIVADLALVQNGPAPGYNSACQAPTNPFDVSGKIALIRRGGCFFSNKVKNAQDAGALAVIVMDSIPDNPVRLSMSSTGILGITIPAVFVTKEIGDEFVAEMANGPVNVKLEIPAGLYLYADGDFDNGIIAHEYGHGISNRLVGNGAMGCMSNAEAMGEGWSDWFALMMQIKPGETGAESRGIGTYAVNQTPDDIGIRNFQYSTDMTINPLTLAESNDAEVHNLGEPWAATLWDLTWAYIDKYGFDTDIYNGTGGNNKVMRLVIDALKLDTCNNASFINGRNNLIAADQATTGGADYCLITEVFTRRGMGLNASSGSVTDPLDQVADFTPFPAGPNCTLSVNYFENEDMIRVYPNPSNNNINLRINGYVGKLNIQLVDINGRIVLSSKDVDFNIEKAIDLNTLQSGVYILKVAGDNLNYSEKIIKN